MEAVRPAIAIPTPLETAKEPFRAAAAPIPHLPYRKIRDQATGYEGTLARSTSLTEPALLSGYGASRFSPQKGELVGIVLNLLLDADAGRVAAGEAVVQQDRAA